MMDECEPLITLPGPVRGALAVLFQNSVPGQIYKISRNLCVVCLSPTQDINWLTSTLSKANLESSAQSKETSSETGNISMPAKVGTCTLRWRSSSGQTFGGLGTYQQTENSPSRTIIDITVGDSCARRLVTELIMVDDRERLLSNLRLTFTS